MTIANLKKTFLPVFANNTLHRNRGLYSMPFVMNMKCNFYLIGWMLLITPAINAQETQSIMEATKPVVCRLTTTELQKRKATVIAELKALVLERTELTNGYKYEFNGTDEILDKLNTFIKTERMCCDFFTFQLVIDGDKALFYITGPEGAKEFLKEEIDL